MNPDVIVQAMEDLEKLMTIPDPFDLELFIGCLEQARDRRIVLSQLPEWGNEAPCGLWIATETIDHVFHARTGSQLHRTHIVLHEIAHMLLGHSGDQSSASFGAIAFLPDLDPELIRTVLGRGSYSDTLEHQAESLATMVLAGRAFVRASDKSIPPAVAKVIQRIGQVWGRESSS